MTSWTGYKLHIDVADGDIPVTGLLTSASLHDSQAAIPLAAMTAQRVTNCYDLMDSAYDAPEIWANCRALGHVPIIDRHPCRVPGGKIEFEAEAQAKRRAGYKMAEDLRYNERPDYAQTSANFGGLRCSEQACEPRDGRVQADVCG
jgi:hypothetical protein